MNIPRPSISVHCPNCDVVRVPAEVVTLRHCTDDGRWDYWLRCPECGLRLTGPSSWWLAFEAFAAGSGLVEWHLPDELNEPHHGLPLTLLDLAALHLALSEPDWIAALERTTDRRDGGSPSS